MLSAREIQDLQSNGYHVARGVFDAAQISEFRKLAIGTLRAGEPSYVGRGCILHNAIVDHPELSAVAFDEQLLKLVRSAIKAQRPLFCNAFDILANMDGGWHRDSGEFWFERSYFNSRDYTASPRHTVYKVIIYLQDQVQPNSGIYLRVGSHRHPPDAARVYPKVHCTTEAGDVLLIDVRLEHSAPIINGWWNTLFREVVRRTPIRIGCHRTPIDLDDSQLMQSARIGMFFCYGAPTDETRTYAKYNMLRILREKENSSPMISTDLENSCRRLNIESCNESFENKFWELRDNRFLR